jgi:outer membrane immunogenic protein
MSYVFSEADWATRGDQFMALMRIGILAAIGLIGGATIAAAADLRPAYKAPLPAPPPPVADWSGIYSGFEGGYGWGRESFDPAFDPFGGRLMAAWLTVDGLATPTVDSIHQKGWLFGGFVGAQKQWGNWVLGIEADYDAANIKGSATSSAVTQEVMLCNAVCGLGSVTRSVTIDSKIDELGSVRGKAGWAFAPNWLLYGTGGLAFAHVKYTASVSETANYVDFWQETNTANALGGVSRLGWALGAGVDWRYQIDQGSSWVFGVEYLHYGFPADTITLTDNLGSGNNFAINTKQSVDAIKGRISYLFSIH